MVTPHLHCEAKYLIRFSFTRGGPVPPNVSKSHVELPGFFRSFFKRENLFGFGFGGVYPRKLDLVWELVCGEPLVGAGCPVRGRLFHGHSARLGSLILLIPEPQVPGIFPYYLWSSANCCVVPLGLAQVSISGDELRRLYSINVPLILRHMVSALSSFPWRLGST